MMTVAVIIVVVSVLAFVISQKRKANELKEAREAMERLIAADADKKKKNTIANKYSDLV